MSVESSGKKRKHTENALSSGEPSSKKPRKTSDKSRKERKGKGRESDSQLEKGDSAFRVVSSSVVLSIPPVFAMDPMKGVHEMLDSLVMKYVPSLRGVMLAHSNVRFLSRTASIKAECPFTVCSVGFDATVWSPQVGMKLTGKINLCSPDHVALLVLRTFNVSIPRPHIVTESWEFEYGAAENDPEFGGGSLSETDETSMHIDNDGVKEEDDGEEIVEGSWVHKVTGDKLGGNDGFLEFTVIGLNVANRMLTLVGSLQDDPFDPRHIPIPAAPASTLPGETEEEEEVDELIDDHEHEGMPERRMDPLESLEESSDEDDPFTLGIIPADSSKSTSIAKDSVTEGAETKEERRRKKEMRRKEKEERRIEKEQKRQKKEKEKLEKLEKKREKEEKRRRKEEKKKRKHAEGGPKQEDAYIVKLDSESPKSEKKRQKVA